MRHMSVPPTTGAAAPLTALGGIAFAAQDKFEPSDPLYRGDLDDPDFMRKESKRLADSGK